MTLLNNTLTGKILAIAVLVAAIAYIIIPIDFDGPIYGLTDDFCFFMAAFCYAQSRFINPGKVSARNLLKRIALIFACLGIAALAILSAIATL